jgi:hypothetical protein
VEGAEAATDARTASEAGLLAVVVRGPEIRQAGVASGRPARAEPTRSRFYLSPRQRPRRGSSSRPALCRSGSPQPQFPGGADLRFNRNDTQPTSGCGCRKRHHGCPSRGVLPGMMARNDSRSNPPKRLRFGSVRTRGGRRKEWKCAREDGGRGVCGNGNAPRIEMRPRRFDWSARLPVSRIVSWGWRRRVDDAPARPSGASDSDCSRTT